MNVLRVVRRNWRICMALEAIGGMFFGNSVSTTYYIKQFGFSLTQIFVIQTIISLATICSDVPFGYLADKVGVRRVTILGYIIGALQVAAFPLCRTYGEFQVLAIATGLQLGAISNITRATMTLSLDTGMQNKEAQRRLYQKFCAQSKVYSSYTYAAAVIAGGVMVYAGGILAPFIAQPVLNLAMVVLSFCLVQPKQPTKLRKRPPIKLFRMMLVDRRDIRYLILLFMVVNTLLPLGFRLIQPKLIADQIPFALFQVFYLAWGFATALWAKQTTWLTRRFNHINIWAIVFVAASSGAMLAGLTNSAWGVVCLITGLTTITAFSGTLSSIFLQKALPGDRSTHNAELAVVSTTSTLSVVVIGPAFGAVVDATSINAGLIGISVVGLSTGCCILWAFKRAT